MIHERRFDPKSAHKLEAADRGQQFPVEIILDAAEVRSGQTVADIGAGSGYFALPLARRVEPATVYAVEPSDELRKRLQGKLAEAGAPANVEPVHGESNATGLPPASCDLVFLSAVWHEIDNHEAALREFWRITAPGAKLAMVDWSPDAAPPPGPPHSHRIPHQQIEHALEQAGWSVVMSGALTDWTYMVVAQR